MTLIEVTNYIANAVGVKQDDTRNLALIKSYINESYLLLSKTDKRLTRAYMPIINGIATIPNNSIGILRTIPKLDKSDSTHGNSILTEKTGVIEAIYFYLREALIEDDEEFDLSEVLQKAIINYVCSMMFRKDGEIQQANSYYDMYSRNISEFEQIDMVTPEGVVEVDY